MFPQIDLSQGQTINVTIAAESNLTLSVVILRHSVPLHEIVWRQEGLLLFNGNNRIMVDIDTSLSSTPPIVTTLQRTSVIPFDSGIYTVTASNSVGNTSFSFNVSIFSKLYGLQYMYYNVLHLSLLQRLQ